MRRACLAATVLLLAALTGCSTVTYSPIADNLHTGQYALTPYDVPDSLLVATYNIAFAEQIEQALADIRANPQLNRADILMLQEMDTQGARAMAKALKMNFIYWPAFVHQQHGRTFGNAVLSPWPIVDQQAVVLPHPNPLDGHHRLAVAADVQIGEHKVRAISVHLSTMVVSLENRLVQAQVLIDSLGAGHEMVVIAGDFNTAAESALLETRRLMRKAGYRTARIDRYSTVHSGPLDKTRYKLILDHIFYRGLRAGSRGIDRTAEASDHYPIWSNFSWTPRRNR